MSVKIAITVSALYASIIKECRTVQGISQAKIAESVGVSPSMWSRIEGGDSPLTVEYLRAAADAMSVKISRICLLAEHIEEDILPEKGISIAKPGDKDSLGGSKIKEEASIKTAVPEASVASMLPLLIGGGAIVPVVASLAAVVTNSLFSISGKDFAKAIGLRDLVNNFIFLEK